MKAILILSALFLVSVSTSWAQTGFSYGREIRYPTEFKIKNNGDANGTQIPSVEPSGFTTRKTGTSIEITSVSVSGVVRVSQGANGQEIAILQPEKGNVLKVATGSVFQWNGHTLKAMGWKGGRYLVYDLNTKKAYAFTKS